jgi:hypothetical protein
MVNISCLTVNIRIVPTNACANCVFARSFHPGTTTIMGISFITLEVTHIKLPYDLIFLDIIPKGDYGIATL